MILSPTYSRIAVRPFPLTGQMKQIVTESTEKLRVVVSSYLKGLLKDSRYRLWYGDQVQVGKDRVITLIVVLKIEARESVHFGGHLQATSDRSGMITITCTNGTLDKTITYDPSVFYRMFQQTLNHELVHATDPKFWSSGIAGKMPQYYQPDESFEKYLKHPLEKSAWEGSTYYYFHDSASKGISMKDALNAFFQHALERRYREHVQKSGKKAWKDYVMRIKKAAAQAYSDLEKR